MKSIYIAAAYGRKAEVKNYATHMRSNGIVVNSSWHDIEGADITDPEELSPLSPAAGHAYKDIDEIKKSEAFLFFSSRDHDVKGSGGRHTEFGIAWVSGVWVYMIGRPENVFQAMVPLERRFDVYHEFFDRVIKT